MRPYDASREIRLAAKSGFLTKRIWREFFGAGGARWQNLVWKSFLEKEFFQEHPSKYATDVLILNSKNKYVHSLVGEEISSPPYISQMDHDETVMRGLLDLQGRKLIDDFRFEQELKRESGVRYVGGGYSGAVKFPDAVVRLARPGKFKVLAIEMELSRKTPKRYRQTMDALVALKGVDRVVFVTRTEVITAAIQRAMRDNYYPYWERPIGFVRLADWQESPAVAPILFESESTSMEKLNAEKPRSAG